MYRTVVSSPVGLLHLCSDGSAITGLWLEGQKYFPSDLEINTELKPELPVFHMAEDWLQAYFEGKPHPPLPPLRPQGSAFRQAVWALLRQIPPGDTVTYGQLAETLRKNGVSAAAQAVGGAVGHNPISILIPCHRVVGADGSLTGYAGGIDVKKQLLQLEGVEISRFSVPKRGKAR